MKKMPSILMVVVVTIVSVFAMMGCADTSQMQSDIDKLSTTIATLTEKVNDLSSENKTLTGKVDDLTTENGVLKDRIEGLNVFWTDKAEYGEHETMTVYFKNQPVLKIRIDFDNIYRTALWGSFNFDLKITSLCADIYDESITGTMILVWDNGTCLRKTASSVSLIKQNIEKSVGGYFTNIDEAYANGTWFDLVICVPGTPFELARFKNVSRHE